MLCLSDEKDLIVTTEDMQSQQTQSASQKPIYEIYYSNNCLNQPLKNRQNKCHKDQRWLKEGGKYCRMLSWSVLLERSQYFHLHLAISGLENHFCLFLGAAYGRFYLYKERRLLPLYFPILSHASSWKSFRAFPDNIQ